MANLGRNRSEELSDEKLDLSLDGQTTDPGESPRSTCSSHPGPCKDQDLVKSTRWADCDVEEIKSKRWADLSDSDLEETNVGKEQRPLPPWRNANNKGRKDEEKFGSKGAEKTGGKGVGKDGSEGKWRQQGFNNKRFGKGKNKGHGKGWQQSSSTGLSGFGKREHRESGKHDEKGMWPFQCQLILATKKNTDFEVPRSEIRKCKRIWKETGAKSRLRGRGSGHQEGPQQLVSTDDLMLCLCAQNEIQFEAAKKVAEPILEDIYGAYQAFCRKAGHFCLDFKEARKTHEGYREQD